MTVVTPTQEELLEHLKDVEALLELFRVLTADWPAEKLQEVLEQFEDYEVNLRMIYQLRDAECTGRIDFPKSFTPSELDELLGVPDEEWTVTNSDGIAIGKVTKLSVSDGGVAVGEPVVKLEQDE